MQQALIEIRNCEKEIEQQQETVDHLEKLRDQQVKQAADNAEKVSIHRWLIRVVTVSVTNVYNIRTSVSFANAFVYAVYVQVAYTSEAILVQQL